LNRIASLLVMLVLVIAGCTSQSGSSADATPDPTPEPTAEPTEEPTPEPTATEDSDGSSGGGDLTALLPDEVGGLSRTDIPGMEAMISGALASTGVNAEGAEYAFASYGDGTQALIVTALRIPGLPEASLQALAAAMAGTNTTGADVETMTVGGKEVLQMTGEGAPGAAYLYFAEGAVFTVVGEDPDLAGQLLSALP
jgi:hypothetical protein